MNICAEIIKGNYTIEHEELCECIFEWKLLNRGLYLQTEPNGRCQVSNYLKVNGLYVAEYLQHWGLTSFCDAKSFRIFWKKWIQINYAHERRMYRSLVDFLEYEGCDLYIYYLRGRPDEYLCIMAEFAATPNKDWVKVSPTEWASYYLRTGEVYVGFMYIR